MSEPGRVLSAPMRIPIKYNVFGRVALTLFGAPPRSSFIELRDDTVHVQMGWMFRATFPRTLVTGVATKRAWLSLGVHGARGRWLVNGAMKPLASMTLSEPARAQVVGFSVQLTELMVSVADPDALAAELARARVL